ncbi:electron transfer flavoprotein subunit beta/FixA family protein [Treponema sp. OttesenSCG-928-L16]|nr:electron transfer flavoprotein subunit beta/FixA family protein [Treponema sp. OttesenSCG-928-L16]
MKIIVPVKQVPESSNVKMDPETGTVIRTGIESVVNPLDLYAIEAALMLKEQYGAEVWALSMGPLQAMKVIKEAAAMGCDHGILISDRKFGGSDTWATSYIIAQAIRKIGDFDLIICGERATDGDTAQVGPGIGAHLDIPVAAYVSSIGRLDKEGIRLERLVEEGYQQLSMAFPCLITVLKAVARPRLPTLKGKIRAKEMDIPVFSSENMDLDPECLGLKGSPTKVVKIENVKVARSGKLHPAQDDDSLAKTLDELVAVLEERSLI